MKCFECAGGAAGATAVSFDTFFSSFHFEKNTQDDSGVGASGLSAVVVLRSGFRLGSNPFSRCGHVSAFTYNYVKTHPEHSAPHDLSASQSEAARSECVVIEAATALGSSSFITDATGYAVQHLQYLPFGETFVDQQNGYDSRYTFSAKEKDDETQYSYFGARYYDSDLSVWLSVDPMSDKYPHLSPYAYVGNMPIIAYDPDGRKIVIVYRDDNNQKQKMEYTPGMTYSGGNEFVSNSISSLNHKYATDSQNQNVIGSLVSIKQNVKIKETNRGNKFVPLTRTVRWNQSSAMTTIDFFTGDGTGAQTPSSGLLHELGHAFWKFLINKSTKNDLWKSFTWDDQIQYTNEQEKWVIENIENKCLDSFEAQRNTHYASGGYEASGPNTIEKKFDAQKAAMDRVSEKIENIAL